MTRPASWQTGIGHRSQDPAPTSALSRKGITADVRGWPGAIPLTVYLLDPFDPATAGDRKAISAEARRRIVEAIEANGGRLWIEP